MSEFWRGGLGWVMVCGVLGLGACAEGSLSAPPLADVDMDTIQDMSGGGGATCGDGLVAATEGCDDGNLVDGDGCSGGCTVEPGWRCDDQAPSNCMRQCGDGVIHLGEECDGTNLGGKTCMDFDASAGTLRCAADCTYDQSGCVFAACGDGTLDGGERCDDGNRDPGDGCSGACTVESGWSCDQSSPSVCTPLCGNGQIDEGEDCDGADLGGQDCTDVGAEAGTLACAEDCTFDVSACEATLCGNGRLDAGEQCDEAMLDGQTCASLGMGYVGGQLACFPTCRLDDSGCRAPMCGDGNIEGDEVCEPGDFDGRTCAGLGYVSGELSCQSCSMIDESGCLNCEQRHCTGQGSASAQECNPSSSLLVGRAEARDGVIISGDTTNVSDAIDELSFMGCFDNGPDVFARIFLESGDELELLLETMESTFDMALFVYAGDQCSAPLTCSDSGFGGDAESVDFVAPNDGWYTIAIQGALSEDQGPYELTMTLTCGIGDCCCP